jgi:hypothetical protein
METAGENRSDIDVGDGDTAEACDFFATELGRMRSRAVVRGAAFPVEQR